MKIYERTRFIFGDRTCQEVWTRGDSILLRRYGALTCLTLVKDELQPTWTYFTPKGYSIRAHSLGDPSCIVWDEGWSEPQKQYQLVLAAISLLTGVELWRYPIPPSTYPNILGTPQWIILRKGRNLHMLDRKSGIEYANFVSPGIPVAYVPNQQESLIVAKHDHLFELESATGNIRWSCSLGKPIKYTVATPTRLYGITQAINQKDGIFCIDLEAGCLAWHVSLPAHSYKGLGVPAIDTTDGTIYLSDLSGGSHQINPDGTVQWSIAGTEEPLFDFVAAPAICRQDSSKYVFFITQNGRVRLVDPDQGRIEDKFETGEKLLETSPVVRKGKLQIFLTLSDRVLLLEAT